MELLRELQEGCMVIWGGEGGDLPQRFTTANRLMELRGGRLML